MKLRLVPCSSCTLLFSPVSSNAQQEREARRRLVVSNTGNCPQPFAVKYHRNFFPTAMPSEEVGTCVW